MKENYLPQALYWLVYSIVALFLLSLIPPFDIGSFNFKAVNLLADVEPDPTPIQPKPDTVVLDSIPAIEPEVVMHRIDSCKKGVTCIEDYSENGNALASFIEGLDESKSKPVRIAFYGDSFIEGDILTSSLRDTLQRIFGGRGVGFVPITSEVARYRTTVKHSFTNWKTFSIVSNYEEEPKFGIGGMMAVPEEDNSLEYSPGYGAWLNKLTLFYSAEISKKLHYTIRDTLQLDTMLHPSTGLSKIDFYGLRSKNIKFNLNASDSIQCYGVSIEENSGLYVDNLAMRGNSGIALSRISNTMLRQSNRLRPYRLAVFLFGLNAVGEKDSTDYTGYTQSMVRVINKFKESLDDCSILIVSVSDRSNNQNGTFKTIPGIKLMVQAQRNIAKKTGVAFWDLFTAMGGENSMPNFVNAKPAMAARDYTHFNFKGGKYLAKKLADALLYEQERYAKEKLPN